MSQGRSIYIAVPRYTFIPNLFRNGSVTAEAEGEVMVM